MIDCPSLLKAILIFNLINSLFLPSIISVKATNGEPFTVDHRLHIYESWIFVMGEVINNQKVPIGNVSVRITLLDSNYAVMKKISTTVWLEVILPNRRAPFTATVEKQEVDGFASYSVEVEHYERCEAKPFGLSISSGNLGILPNCTLFRVFVKNEALEAIDYLIVIGCLYDDRGFLDAASEQIETELLPGAFEERILFFKFANQSSNIKKYVLTAESVLDTSYAIKEEVVRLIVKASSDENSYIYHIILLIAAIASVPIVTIMARRLKRKPQRIRHHAKQK